MAPAFQMPELILAYTSPARTALLKALGLPFQTEAPGVDESFAQRTPVAQAVRELALRKARAVHARHPAAFVLGADQLVSFRGRPLGKPKDRAAAREQLASLRGQQHEILTGVCLVGPSFEEAAVEVARLTFYAISDAELERYLDLREWEGCAGGYRVEGAGQALMQTIDGDRSNIQGLPMLSVVAMLRRAGFSFF